MERISYLILLSIILFSISCESQEKATANSVEIEIFEQIWRTVNDHFYDPDFNGIDWHKKKMEYQAQIEVCTDTDSLFILLNKMLFELNSSHCGVGTLSDLTKSVSPYIFSNGEIGMDIRLIGDQIIITEVLKNSSADKQNMKRGYAIKKIDGLTLTDIANLVNYKPPFNNRNQKFHLTAEVFRRIYGEAGSIVKIEYADGQNQHHTVSLKRTERKNGISLGGGLPPAFLNSESYFISDHMAYLSFNAFNPPDLDHVLNDLAKVYGAKGLIIDLRGNDGGSIEGMKLLLGRFISETRKYGTYINRHEYNEDFISPVGRKYEGKLAILVDEMSISGAENMAGIIKQFEIGKVIGNQTPGQMLWGNGYLIRDSIALAIPIYKLAYTDGFNPENNGITPDIEVSLSREDLLRGCDTQLQKAIEFLESEITHP